MKKTRTRTGPLFFIFLPNVLIHICGDPRHAMTPSLGREKRKSGTGLDYFVFAMRVTTSDFDWVYIFAELH